MGKPRVPREDRVEATFRRKRKAYSEITSESRKAARAGGLKGVVSV